MFPAAYEALGTPREDGRINTPWYILSGGTGSTLWEEAGWSCIGGRGGGRAATSHGRCLHRMLELFVDAQKLRI